ITDRITVRNETLVGFVGVSVLIGDKGGAVHDRYRFAGQPDHTFYKDLTLIIRKVKKNDIVSFRVAVYIRQTAGNDPVSLADRVFHGSRRHHGVGENKGF